MPPSPNHERGDDDQQGAEQAGFPNDPSLAHVHHEPENGEHGRPIHALKCVQEGIVPIGGLNRGAGSVHLDRK